MFTIYEKNACPFCVRAKALLEKKGLEYQTINAVDNREALIERVVATGNPEPKSVPQIFHNDEYIGGYTELSAYFAKQALA